MSTTNPCKTLSSREFNQDAGGAKRAAEEGPVYITDRGRPAHVLMSIEHYRRLTGSHASIVDLLAMPANEVAEFEAARLDIGLRVPDYD